MKNKTTAGLLALLLGGLGVHKFYLGRGGMGVLYLVFCWTFIPSIIAFFEAIILFTMNDHDFNLKYNAGMIGIAPQAQPQNIVVNVANTATTGGGDRLTTLKQLHDLKVSGALTSEEYEAQKQKLLAASH
jgi:TM2 domain-containing membrane protein YozV